MRNALVPALGRRRVCAGRPGSQCYSWPCRFSAFLCLDVVGHLEVWQCLVHHQVVDRIRQVEPTQQVGREQYCRRRVGRRERVWPRREPESGSYSAVASILIGITFAPPTVSPNNLMSFSGFSPVELACRQLGGNLRVRHPSGEGPEAADYRDTQRNEVRSPAREA